MDVFAPLQLQDTAYMTCGDVMFIVTSEQESSGRMMSSSTDFQMDLLRAVEMSRLQFLAETSRALAFGLPEG